MRYTILALLVVAMIALSMASPAKDNNNKKQAPACSTDCGDKYDPVCGKAKNNSKERLITFGSECVMANYNCGHAAEPFEVKSRGECGGNVAVLLS